MDQQALEESWRVEWLKWWETKIKDEDISSDANKVKNWFYFSSKNVLSQRFPRHSKMFFMEETFWIISFSSCFFLSQWFLFHYILQFTNETAEIWNQKVLQKCSTAICDGWGCCLSLVCSERKYDLLLMRMKTFKKINFNIWRNFSYIVFILYYIILLFYIIIDYIYIF